MADAWVVKSGVWRRYTVKEKNEENGKWKFLFYFVHTFNWQIHLQHSSFFFPPPYACGQPTAQELMQGME